MPTRIVDRRIQLWFLLLSVVAVVVWPLASGASAHEEIAVGQLISVERIGGPAIGVYVDDFSSYELTNFTNPPVSLVSINGQIAPSGNFITGSIYCGVATDAVITNTNDGNPGGVPPATAPFGGEPYLALARRTGLAPRVLSPATGAFFQHPPFMAGFAPETAHIRVATDWYLTDARTSYSWSVESSTQGAMVDQVYFGGTSLPEALAFAQSGDDVLENFVSLGVLDSDPTVGQFFAPTLTDEFPFPVNKWFTVMSVIARDSNGVLGQGLFIKTPDTVANGFLDPRMAAGLIVPVDGDPVGWVNTYPGVVDDPMTSEIEGIGLARTAATKRLRQPARSD